MGSFQSTAAAELLQSCPTLCNPMDSSPPGSSVPGILQARILEWVAISFFNACLHAKSLQACPNLCDPMYGSPAGSSVHGILQARILEWVALSFSRGSSYSGTKSKSSALQADSLPYEPQIKIKQTIKINFIGNN